jgi:hypothetical protein
MLQGVGVESEAKKFVSHPVILHPTDMQTGVNVAQNGFKRCHNDSATMHGDCCEVMDTVQRKKFESAKVP